MENYQKLEKVGEGRSLSSEYAFLRRVKLMARKAHMVLSTKLAISNPTVSSLSRRSDWKPKMKAFRPLPFAKFPSSKR